MPNQKQVNIPLFSVVIPVYNRVNTLSRAIDSVLEQTQDDYEVLVVDDGSDAAIANEIKQLVKEYQLKIQLIRHEVNINGAAARNSGINAAIGKYVSFLDSDDIWHSDKLRIVTDVIEKQSPQVIYHQYNNIKNGQSSVTVPKVEMSKGESVADYMFVSQNKVGIQTSTLTVCSALAKKTLFNDKLRGHQDWDFTLRLGEKCDHFQFVSQPLTTRYISGTDNVSGKLNFYFSRDFLNSYKKYFSLRARICFSSRVLLKKALVERCYRSHFSSLYFFLSLFYDSDTVWSTIKSYIQDRRRLRKRLSRLKKQLSRNSAKEVIIYGANNYTKAILLANLNVDILAVVDGDNKKTGMTFAGIPVSTPDSGLSNCNNLTTWIVLASDRYAAQMAKSVAEMNPALSKQVIAF